jgi:hypothetical protein
MSTETQLKIAKILGYEWNDDCHNWRNPTTGHESPGLPDWQTDLNACLKLWEFMQTQSDAKRFIFCLFMPKKKIVDNFYTHMLTEPQLHCEAFLKAMEVEKE